MKKALITGITGQDGSYLAELLLEKGYETHGITRSRADKNRFWRIEHIKEKIKFYEGNVANDEFLRDVFSEIMPDEVYHLAGQRQSHDFEKDFTTFPLNIDVTRTFLSLMKEFKPACKLFFAGSCEMFGKPAISPQDEKTPFGPCSSYGISKVAGYSIVKMFRDAYDIFACTGILYNHESPRRDLNYLTRKVAIAAARIKAGLQDELELGDLSAKRDWGYAKEYAEAMWLMLQQEKPDDYVLGTGETRSVEEFVDAAFGVVSLDWRRYVKINPAFARSPEKFERKADISKAKTKLGWVPKTGFKELARIMVEAEINRV